VGGLRGWWSRRRDEGELSCRELVRLVTDYLEGELPERDRRRFEQHIRRCDGCTTYLQQMRETIELLGGLSEESIDSRARDKMLSAFRDWAKGR
jgi:anti-sigma factor RsiW